MKKRTLLMGIFLFCVGCADPATVTIGRGSFDPATHRISETTDAFSRGDFFHIVVERKKPFDAPEYFLRLSVKDGAAYRTISNESQAMTGSYRGFHREFPVSNLKQAGDYRVEIVMRGKVIGSRDFTVRP
jgi:hypothetical protein